MTCEEARDFAPLYVLGALSAAEAEEVQALISECAELREDLEILGGAVPYLAEAVEQVEPPVGLKARVLAAAVEDLAARGSPASAPWIGRGSAAPSIQRTPSVPSVTSRPSAPPAPARPATVVPFPARRPAVARGRVSLGFPSPAWLMRAAAVIVLVALAGWNFVLQQDVSSLRAYQARVTDAIALASQPGSRIALLAPAPNAPAQPGGIAVITASGGRVVMHDLPATSGSQVYEAWVIGADGKPLPAGSLQVDRSGVGYLDQLTASATGKVTVGITLEPGPNPTTPTMPILSSGVADQTS